MDDDVAVVREPSLADALIPLGTLAVLSIGSSWTTAATIRADLVGVAVMIGVSTLLYLPYAVFCYASPGPSVTGFRIEKTDPITLEEKR